MAFPLIWIGAGIAAIAAGNHIAREQQKSAGIIGHFPGDCKRAVTPQNGAIVCCGIYEVFEHSGIWVDGQIIELKGNGLIRVVSPERFLEDRSGDRIYMACDEQLFPLCETGTANRAVSRLYQFSEYHVLNNNCHRFVSACLTQDNKKITRFSELNTVIHDYFLRPVHWQPINLHAAK